MRKSCDSAIYGEPGTNSLHGGTITGWTINWGDGSSPQTFSTAPLPSVVPHVYTTTGPWTINVTASTTSGPYSASTAVWNDGVTTVLPLGGDSTTAAGNSYTLTLGDGQTDLGSGPLVSYLIHWHDGTADTPVSADDLAAAFDQVTHVFNAATTVITVDLIVSGHTSSVGSLPLTVDFSSVTTTTLTPSTTSTALGGTITLTAAVAPAVSGKPTGTVEFYDQVSGVTIDLGAGTLNSGTPPVATLATPPLANGTHSFTAVYGGDGTFSQSTSAAATAYVGTASSVSIGGPYSIGEGNFSLTLPTTAGGQTISQWSFNWGDGTAYASTGTHVYGLPGTYTITAVAHSSAGYFLGTATVTVLQVAPGVPTVTVDNAYYSGADTEDGGSLAPDQLHVSFTGPALAESYNVSINWGGGSAPTTFSLDPGQASFDYPLPQYTASGTYPIIVTVTDAEGNSASNATTPLPITYSNVAPSGLTLSLDQSIVPLGSGAVLSGSFSDPQYNLAHVVTIQWGDGNTTTVSLPAGETTFTSDPYAYSAAGNYTMTATIAGVDGTVTQPASVTVVSSNTTLAASPSNPTFGQTVTLTATVTATPAGAAAPTGTVDFYDNTTDTDLGTVNVNSSGVATLSISSLALGGHDILAAYSGDGNFPGSEADTTVSVVAPPLSLGSVVVSSSVTKGGIATVSGCVNNLDGSGFQLNVGWGQGAGDSIAYSGTNSFSLTHQYVDYSGVPFLTPYPVSITVISTDGRSASDDSHSIRGANAAPSVFIAGRTYDIWPRRPVELSSVVADPGQNGAFTYNWTASDGNETLPELNDTTGYFSFTPGYHDAYTVSLSVTDADGQRTSAASVTIPPDSVGATGTVFSPFTPDQPTVTIEETDGGETVVAGQPANFQISVSGDNMPHHGPVTVFYRTQDGTAAANADYTGSGGDQELTFTWNGSGYAPQTIQVPTTLQCFDDANKQFSVVIPCFYDPFAATPSGQGPTAAANITPATVDGEITRVEFTDANTLYEDPTGTAADPIRGAKIKPVWDSSYPVNPIWYTSGTQASVSATFTLTTPVTGGVTVIATSNEGFSLDVPGTVNGNKVTIENAIASAFCNKILVDPDFMILWSLQVGSRRVVIGGTDNPLYLSYKTPLTTTTSVLRNNAAKYDDPSFKAFACQTVVYLGCKYGGGDGSVPASKLTSLQVLENIFQGCFETLKVTNAAGDKLYYYRTYNNASNTLPGLLATGPQAKHDGQCMTWAYLFGDVALAQGINGVSVDSTSPNYAPRGNMFAQVVPCEQVLINTWNFANFQQGTNATALRSNTVKNVVQVYNNATRQWVEVSQYGMFQQRWLAAFPYANLISDPQSYTLTNSYRWQNNRADVTYAAGTPGQNQDKPAAIFGGHWGCGYYDNASKTSYLFDPSYGSKPYSAPGNANFKLPWDSDQSKRNATAVSLGRDLSKSIAGLCVIVNYGSEESPKYAMLFHKR